MKKIYFLFSMLALGFTATAQSIPNGGLDTWRDNTSGSVLTGGAKAVHAPVYWYGLDSLIIADGEIASAIFGIGDGNYKAQLFQENTIKHGGTSSARIVTIRQDTLGLFPGIMTNTKIDVNLTSALGGGDPIDAVSYHGGTAVSQRPTAVSAWVEYYPGLDSGMASGDSATLAVQVQAHIRGIDSTVGVGYIIIGPSTSFVQVTAPIVYNDSTDLVDTMRIVFTSSGGGRGIGDSSILYVDDVTYTSVPQAVAQVQQAAQAVKVYPNPAATAIWFDGPQTEALTCRLYDVSGKEAITPKALKGATSLDVSALPAGVYFYTISDSNGITVQHGKLNVAR